MFKEKEILEKLNDIYLEVHEFNKGLLAIEQELKQLQIITANVINPTKADEAYLDKRTGLYSSMKLRIKEE